MTAPEIYELLDAPLDPLPPGPLDDLGGLDDAGEHFMRHLVHGLSALQTIGPQYRELIEDRAGGSTLPRETIVELAGQVAAVLQSALRRPEVFQALPNADIQPVELIGLLEELLHSLVLLAQPDEELEQLAMSADELDELYTLPIVRAFLPDDRDADGALA